MDKPTGIELIAKEREEQINKHGYTKEQDLMYQSNELLQAASGILGLPRPGTKSTVSMSIMSFTPPTGWDKFIWSKMCSKPYKERLIIAGALIAAELDRLTAIEAIHTQDGGQEG
ncbi:hypothetical protein ACF3OC_08500 [Sphingobacterium cellulitidis]|uniref:hypothetical protein n=1 Tax=Sphingobacterium cellulitidis TaxID=1768011 RepID=UPI000B942756|nr:hypothetical protein CHT99_10405 [Sphingobacterium cellulitidis]